MKISTNYGGNSLIFITFIAANNMNLNRYPPLDAIFESQPETNTN